MGKTVSAKHISRSSAAAVALKKSLHFFFAAAVVFGVASYGLSKLFTEDVVLRSQETTWENLSQLWRSYQHYFIRGGQVIRPKNDFDTVSEGQAYAMLRAVWMNDRKTFDEIYHWTETHLSRLQKFQDHLLAWRYGSDSMGGTTILDENPALDADLDYALALFLAAKAWPDGRPPVSTMPYRDKALAVADSIMAKGVFLHPTGELVLMPWPITGSQGNEKEILVNPSYFSPGHYRLFEAESGNRRWGKLASDTYRQLDRLMQMDGGAAGQIVTVPDWIAMRTDGTFVTDQNRGYISGWDAFRLWWRLRIDQYLTGNKLPERLINSRLLPFLNKSMDLAGGDVASESERDGTPRVKYSNPGMSAVYRYATMDISPALSRSLQRQAMRFLKQDGDNQYFQDNTDYYTNSWAWFAMLEGAYVFPFQKYYHALGGAIPDEAKEKLP